MRDLIAEAHAYSEGAAAHTSQEAAEESLSRSGTPGLPFRAATLSCGAIYHSLSQGTCMKRAYFYAPLPTPVRVICIRFIL